MLKAIGGMAVKRASAGLLNLSIYRDFSLIWDSEKEFDLHFDTIGKINQNITVKFLLYFAVKYFVLKINWKYL